jgi:serine/threonine protein kinase/tetratricopeptide (TPR) repeat protein
MSGMGSELNRRAMEPPQAAADIFYDARDLDPHAREEFLHRACGEDGALREAVEDLLALNADADDARFLTGIGDDDRTGTAVPVPPSIGPYRIVRELGRGAQATVFLAHDPALNRQVALKVLRNVLAVEASTLVRRFKREAMAMANLEHTGLCTVYDTGVDDGVAWIAMRYVAGRSLAELLAGQPGASGIGRGMPTPIDFQTNTDTARDGSSPSGTGTGSDNGVMRTAALFEQAARALHVAHEHGVVHRDVKPGNLMLTDAGSPVLLDFGIAHANDGDEGQGLTRTADVLGTPAYMAPEQLRAEPGGIDRRVDVYGLGVTLYECLTGTRPFDAVSREALYRQILDTEPRPLHASGRGIPRDLEVVVATAIEKDPDRRYSSALEFAEDLRRVRCHEPIRARRISAMGRVARWARRRPAVATSVAIAAVAVTAGLAVSLVLLDMANDALANYEAERSARYDGLSRSIARVEVDGELSPHRGQLRRDAIELLTSVAPDLHRRAGEIERLFRPGEFAAILSRVLPVLARECEHLEGDQALAAADLLRRSAVHIMTWVGWVPPADDQLIRDAAIQLTTMRLALLAHVPATDVRVVHARVMLLDALNQGEFWTKVERLVEGWLSYENRPDTIPYPDHVALYESRLGAALVRSGRVAEGRALVERSLEKLDRFGSSEFYTVALASALDLETGHGGGTELALRRRELAERVARMTVIPGYLPIGLVKSAFGPDRRELFDFLVRAFADSSKRKWDVDDVTGWETRVRNYCKEFGIDRSNPLQGLLLNFALDLSEYQSDRVGEAHEVFGRLVASSLRFAGVEIDESGRPRPLPRAARSDSRSMSKGLLFYAAHLAARGRFATAAPWLDASLEAYPTSHIWYHRASGKRGRNLARTGYYPEAERELKAAFAVSEDILGREAPETLWPIRELAALYRYWGRLDEAEHWGREAVARRGRPNDYIALAWTCVTCGRHARAAHAADKALDLDPKNGAAMMVRAHAALQARDFATATRWARASIAAGDRRAQRVLGQVLWQQGKKAEARQAFALAPLDVMMFWSDQAQALADTDSGRVAELRTWFRDLTEDEATGRTGDPLAWNARAWFLATTEHDDMTRADRLEAVRCAERACELCNRGRAHVLATLAEAQFVAGDRAAARRTANAVRKSMASDAEWLSVEQLEARLQEYSR